MHVCGVQVFLDGDPIEVQGASLAAALACGSSLAAERGRVVIEVHADGSLMDEASLGACGSTDHVQQLRLTSADPYLLVQATLDDAAGALQQLARDQTSAARMVHQDRLQDAVSSLQQVFQTWQTVKDVAERASGLLNDNLLAVPVESASGTLLGDTLSTELLVRLRAVKTALSRDDWSRLADVLSHELVELAGKWELLMGGLARYVGEQRPARLPSAQGSATTRSSKGGNA